MPIYEYRCPDCGHEFEVMQRMSEDPIKVCPKCSASNVGKLISRTSFVLKGGGWYKDHYGLKPGGGASPDSGGSTGSSTSTPASASTTVSASEASSAPATPSTSSTAASD